MSYLLEALGRGWIGRLANAFRDRLEHSAQADRRELLQKTQDEPDDAEHFVSLGLSYLHDDHAPQARTALERAVHLEPNGLAARLALACCYEDLGQIQQACTQLNAAAAMESEDAKIQFGLGYCLERLERIDDAITHYQCALDICPGLRNARERLAAIHLQKQDVNSAVYEYMELVMDEPGDVDLHLTLAGLHLQRNDSDAAIRCYELALTIEPDNFPARNDLADTLEEAGLVRESIEQLHLLATKHPEDPNTFLRLGDLYSRIQDDQAAMNAYLKAVEVHPGFLEATVKVGTQFLRCGEYVDAAQWFARAIELNDRMLIGYIGLGVAQHAAGHEAEAWSTLDLAASVEPNSTLLYSEVARLQLKSSMQQEAESQFGSVAIELEVAAPPEDAISDLVDQQIVHHRALAEERPNHPDIHYRLGMLMRQRGNLGEAIDHFRIAAEINPTYTKAVIKLGLALHESGRTDEAIQAFQQAVTLHPEYVDLHYRLGVMFADRQQFGLAVEHFEQVLDAKADDIDARENLAIALENLGMIDRAKAMWHRICEMVPGSNNAQRARNALGR